LPKKFLFKKKFSELSEFSEPHGVDELHRPKRKIRNQKCVLHIFDILRKALLFLEQKNVKLFYPVM
jgi:hypothetical protein